MRAPSVSCPRRLVIVLVAAFALLCGQARAQLFNTYSNGDGTLTIDGYTGPNGAVNIPDNINGMTVTGIAGQPFYGESGITSVTIPASVTNIGVNAFSNCPTLGAIYVTPGNPDYSSSVDGVLFNHNQTTLLEYPSASDLNLSYTIPSTVTSIGPGAFSGTAISGITIPGSVTSIGDSAFDGCTGLQFVTIPPSVTTLGDSVFDDCTNLISANIGNNVTSIGSATFENCSNLTIVMIGNHVTSIGSDSFYQCSNLTSVTIPASVATIGGGAFSDCTSLTSVFFSGNAPTAGSGVFSADNNPTVYHLPAATGWSSSFAGVPTVVFMNQPIVTTQPVGAVVLAGTNTTFTLAVNSTTTPSYQWQVSTNGGATWTNVTSSPYSGTTTATLTITSANATLLGDQYRAAITNSVATTNSTPVSLVVGTSTAKLTWLQTYFTSTQLGNPAIVGDMAEPVGDGMPNLLKYAFNLNPLQDGHASLPQPTYSAGILTLTVPAPQPDLTYTVEASTDLIHWSTAGVHQTNGPPLVANYTLSGTAPAFLQIVVAPAP